jgi:hypothetical protein
VCVCVSRTFFRGTHQRNVPVRTAERLSHQIIHLPPRLPSLSLLCSLLTCKHTSCNTRRGICDLNCVCLSPLPSHSASHGLHPVHCSSTWDHLMSSPINIHSIMLPSSPVLLLPFSPSRHRRCCSILQNGKRRNSAKKKDQFI